MKGSVTKHERNNREKIVIAGIACMRECIHGCMIYIYIYIYMKKIPKKSLSFDG